MKEHAQNLIEQFKDAELAHAHVDGFLNISIAAQIKVLRKQRGLTQGQLGQLAGMRRMLSVGLRISAIQDGAFRRLNVLLRRLMLP